ncbi:pseudaminic acid synthase [Candidatus Beckwithbacteria bacterium RBG_13_42_9]|uniref:Pseudaminic acid synthase n=1 Tax=Candidatus Beckwithbacteria bacterium RBG_13_42_9 TaxID=1797457 RepID=A0A1F5E7G4_9BACT|nr:MAG: pseudaminic acid synthase [Candidatus Beckwithbacteria bacterium RBG_13_42_9]
MKIDKYIINDKSPVFIVAELSCNHRQDFSIAVKTIKAMKKAGADAVKVQTFTPETITFNGDHKYFQIKQGTIWDGTTLHKLYQEAYMPWEWQPKLKKIAENLGLIFFSTPVDETAVDFLDRMKVPAYKIGSFEIVDTPLVKYTASKGKPIIISTGIANLTDISIAVKTCRKAKNKQIALLKCTSAYPTPFNEVNLKTIPDLKNKFKCVIGLSDHTLTTSIPTAAISLGAKIIEKHFILDKKLGGPDAEFSLSPTEFKNMVNSVREVEKALGKVTYNLTAKMKKSREFAPSIFTTKDIKKGEALSEENIKTIRPGFGLAPRYWQDVLGKKARHNIKRGTPLSWKLIN